MTKEDIEKEFEAFFEWPSDDRSAVTAISAKLFAFLVAQMAIEKEREACAKVCENLPKKFRTELCPSEIHDCAAAIRARGQS